MVLKRLWTAVLLMAAVLALWPVIPAVVLENVETGTLAGVMLLEEGDGFHVEFRHSVNRTPVREYYIVRGEALVLTRAEYSSFGAGMPETAEAPGSRLVTRSDGLALEGIDRPMDSFIYRIGTVAEHTLHVNGKSIPLLDLDTAQSPIRFSIRRIRAIDLLRRLD